MSLLQLQELASRQQQQIENTHRILMNKEEQLNYLSSVQDSQQGPISDFDHGLSHFKEKIAQQDAKLRKLRLLKSQIQTQRNTNSNICSEVETIKLLHKEKERELSVALTKIDALTRQLDELQKGNTINSYNINGYKHVTELEKLRQELLYKTKICKQGEEELAFKRNMLYKRQSEMMKIDQKINELQSRLARKRQLNQQLSHVLRASSDNDDDLFASKSYLRSSMGHTVAYKTPIYSKGLSQLPNVATVEPLPRYKGDIFKGVDYVVNKHDPKYQTLPYNTKFGARNVNINYTVPKQMDDSNSKVVSRNFTAMNDECDSSSMNANTANDISLIISAKNDNNKDTSLEERPSPSGSSGSSDRISTSMTAYSYTEKMGLNGRPLTADSHYFSNRDKTFRREECSNESDLFSPRSNQYVPNLSALTKGKEPSVDESKTNAAQDSRYKAKPSVPVKPIAPSIDSSVDMVDNCRYDANFLFAQRPIRSSSENSSLSTPSSGVFSSSEIFSQNTNFTDKGSSNEDLDNMENMQNEQLEERSTVSEIVSKINNWSVSSTSHDWEKNKRRPVVSANEMEKELTQDCANICLEKSPAEHSAHENLTNANNNNCDVVSRTETQNKFPDKSKLEQQNRANNNNAGADYHEATEAMISDKKEHQTQNKSKRIKGNLKSQIQGRPLKVTLGRRVSFDPLALLLDASLEGELELVKKTSLEVPNPSASNDEGITALHNATCAGHFDIVKYLVEIGCDVNVQDSDGWTPLHCAASCNNLVMIQFLVKSGACLFATTFSDHETAAEKCEEDEEGYDGCSQYLYSSQDQLGTVNNGIVYALYDYQSQNSDELSFNMGDSIQVLRKADDQEKEWWWSRLADQEGYIPRNLIGMYPRIKPSFKYISS